MEEQARMEFISAGEWADKYLDEAKGRFVEKTYKEKNAAFKRLFQMRGVGPKMKVAEFVSSDLSETSIAYTYLNAQFQKRGGNAANKDRKNLARAWNWGQKNLSRFPKNLVNPFHAVDRFPKRTIGRYVPPSGDFWKVYEVATGQDKVMLLTALHLGARRGEIFRIKRSDVDFANNNVRLWTRKRERGDQEFDWLPLTMELREMLYKWCEYRFSVPTPDEEHVFVCLDEDPVCEPYYGKPFLKRQFLMKRLCKRAGVKCFGFHGIRHLSATILYHNGKDLNYLQRFLRHQNPTTTQGYLKRLGLEPLREGLEEGFKRVLIENPKTPLTSPILQKKSGNVIPFPGSKQKVLGDSEKIGGVH